MDASYPVALRPDEHFGQPRPIAPDSDTLRSRPIAPDSYTLRARPVAPDSDTLRSRPIAPDSGTLRLGVRAVVFDWAGTVVDFGSRAPAMTFVETFSAQGVPVTEAEARAPMGLPKREHIRSMGMMARVAEAWREIHGSAFDESAVDRLYEAFTPRQVMAVRAHAGVISGVVSVVDALRRRGIRIGSTTGYPRIVMAAITDLAASQGFVPDAMVCADDLPVTRPTPLGMWRCLIELGVWPAWSAVKVDDTVPGLLEGRDAGAWTVGILASGNAAGLTHAEWDALDDRGRQEVRDRSSAALATARPDFTIDTVADLLPVIDQIGHRLWCGERPGG